MSRTLLVLNVGSASLKAGCYALMDAGVRETARIALDVRGDAERALQPQADAQLVELTQRLPLRQAPSAIAHRIVHGGDRIAPTELTPTQIASIEALSPLAPLHQPPAMALVHAASRRWPDAKQIGVFDTAWHHTMPDKHRLFPLPFSLYERGVKRYGFHGLAFQSSLRNLTRIAPELGRARLLLAHLGGGGSLCAVRDGRSVNTTMGLTPLDGIPMASRPGTLDPGVLLYLQRQLAMPPDEIDNLLWRESGLRGLSEESGDMRRLLASGSVGANRAIDVYLTLIVQGIAAMAASIGGFDALVYSGGVGQHAAAIQARIAEGLAWLGADVDPERDRNGADEISAPAAKVRTFVVAIDEEFEIANAAGTLL